MCTIQEISMNILIRTCSNEPEIDQITVAKRSNSIGHILHDVCIFVIEEICTDDPIFHRAKES